MIDQLHFATTQIAQEKIESWSLHEKVEKSKGRVCTRRVAVTNQLDAPAIMTELIDSTIWG